MAKIFISYNSKDRIWAQWIGVTLRDNGHTPFVHEWELGAGQNIPHWMNEKLKLADRLLGVFSDAYTKAIYSGAEYDAAFWEDPEGRKGFLVPVEVETVTDWPPLVKPLRRLSLVDKNETEAETALLAFLEPPRPPDKRPPFPGKHEFADTRIDLDAVLESENGSTTFTAQSEPLPDTRPALPEGNRPQLSEEEQQLWKNVTQNVAPLQPGGPPESPPNTPPSAADEPPDPRDRKAFQKWLEGKPREWSVVIAARAALRVLPLVRQGKFGAHEAAAILLPVFRATAIARFAAEYPNRAIEAYARSAARSAESAARSAESAARSAWSAAWSARSAESAAWSAESAAWSAESAAWSAAWSAWSAAESAAIQQDMQRLVGGMIPARVAREPLWQGQENHANLPPADKFGNWVELRDNLPGQEEQWELWTDWYEDVIAGSPPSPARSEAWEAAFTDVEDSSYPWKGPLPWDDGPEAVNRAIKARLDAVLAAEAAASVGDGVDKASDDPSDPQPIESVASPITIAQRADGRIAAEAGAFALPELPPSLAQEELARTLATCRSQAERLRSTATAPTFNGRPDYGEAFGSYLEWLPTEAGGGNILLADGEARVLNKLFTADEGILATGFAARLSVFLENHIGLRAHYAEIERLYQAVRTGRLEAPLQRDAVEGIKRAVHDNTPAVFDESVPPVVDETAKPVPEPVPLAPEDLPPPDPSRPKPPRDPIADIDPKKSRSFIFAAAANRIWQILLQGKDLPTAIEGWHKTYEQMRPHIGPILHWLRVFTGS